MQPLLQRSKLLKPTDTVMANLFAGPDAALAKADAMVDALGAQASGTQPLSGWFLSQLAKYLLQSPRNYTEQDFQIRSRLLAVLQRRGQPKFNTAAAGKAFISYFYPYYSPEQIAEDAALHANDPNHIPLRSTDIYTQIPIIENDIFATYNGDFEDNSNLRWIFSNAGQTWPGNHGLKITFSEEQSGYITPSTRTTSPYIEQSHTNPKMEGKLTDLAGDYALRFASAGGQMRLVVNGNNYDIPKSSPYDWQVHTLFFYWSSKTNISIRFYNASKSENAFLDYVQFGTYHSPSLQYIVKINQKDFTGFFNYKNIYSSPYPTGKKYTEDTASYIDHTYLYGAQKHQTTETRKEWLKIIATAGVPTAIQEIK